MNPEHIYPLQPLWNIAEICANHNIKNAVLSPGSRCAPLIHGFSNHPDMRCFSIIDERSAGFVAMGIAQQTRNPVVLICTSGTASVNYFSAIAEAFYQNIPLLIFTADRPPELLDQQDGQTIHQREIYGKHVRQSFELPSDFLHSDKIWHTERIINEAIHLCKDFPQKPVHVNVPIREPFYPPEKTEVVYKKDIKLITKEKSEKILSQNTIQKLQCEITKSSRVVIIAAQDDLNSSLCDALNRLHVPVISDIISNTHLVSKRICFHDFTLLNVDFQFKVSEIDLLITFGRSVISKSLKLFLRKYQPKQHWHVQKTGQVADTFKALTRIIPVSASYFFHHVFVNQILDHASIQIQQRRKTYIEVWKNAEATFMNLLPKHFQNYDWSEAEIVFEVLQKIPNQTALHLSNGMSVRYANAFNFMFRKESFAQIEVYANRGTSGIDGSTSTVIGHTLVSDQTHVLITGDLSFFYDKNAFWNHDLPNNLRIILLNNQGGKIFKMISGPSSIPKSESYFVTPHKNTAHLLCQEHGILYYQCHDSDSFSGILTSFFQDEEKPKLLECFTDTATNIEVWQGLQRQIQRKKI